MPDVEKPIQVLQRLIDGGPNVWVIEHVLDLIAETDWVTNLVPKGGCAVV